MEKKPTSWTNFTLMTNTTTLNACVHMSHAANYLACDIHLITAICIQQMHSHSIRNVILVVALWMGFIEWTATKSL